MISLDTAERAIADSFAPLARTIFPLSAAPAGRLASTVRATCSQPQWPQSAMDGYALRHADCSGTLPIQAGLAAAGDQAAVLSPGHALRITTGSPLPRGADTVVIQENTAVENGQLVLTEVPSAGANVRPAGEDFVAGQGLAEAGQELDAGLRSLLHHAGVAEVGLYRQPRLGVVITGSELVAAGPLADGQTYDSNGPFLRAWCAQQGYPVEIQRCDEAPATLSHALQQLRANSDVFVICGGASVGPRDGSHAALGQLGAEAIFTKVAQKPGKPMALYRWGRQPVLLLPGNPAAVFCATWWHLAPLLGRLQGGPSRPPASFRLSGPIPKVRGRSALLRARAWVDPAANLRASILPGQASHCLGNLGQCNAIIRIDPDQNLAAGALAQGRIVGPAAAFPPAQSGL